MALPSDQADEDAGDANGEANRPDGRLRLVRGALTAVRIHVLTRIQSGLGASVNDVAIAATDADSAAVGVVGALRDAVLGPAAVDERSESRRS